MRIIAVGDVHGCRVSLEALANDVGFSPDDTIVMLGDYVDRGPDSRGVIDLLLRWREHLHLVCLKGNHEVMMLEARDSFRGMLRWVLDEVGGEDTMVSYGVERVEDIPEEHWKFVAEGLPYHETETHIFVHGGLEADRSLEAQQDAILYWRRISEAEPHQSGKTVVCGHTSQRNGLPANLGHTICIDTWACGEGWLTALDVGSGTYWQTNEKGERREGKIADRLEQ